MPAAERRRIWLYRLLPAALAVIAGLALYDADRALLMSDLQAWTRQLPDAVWASLTMLGHGGVLFALLAVAWRQRPDWLVAAFYALPIAGLYARLFKMLLVSPRPAGVLSAEQLHIIGQRLTASSFPSGHTVSAFVLAGVIVLAGRVSWRIGAAACAVAVLVGLSRIAVGAHWPTDVLAGIAGGWLAGAAGVALAQKWRWGYRTGAQRLFAALVLISSLSLFAEQTGYPQGLPVQYLAAAIGSVSALFWLRATFR